MRELPYEFDLLYDIKMMYEIEAVAKGEPSQSDATPENLVDLFIAHKLPIPDCLKNVKPTLTHKTQLLIVVIKDSLVDVVHACETVEIQIAVFKKVVNDMSGFDPEDCDYEDGYYEYENRGSICMTSVEIDKE